MNSKSLGRLERIKHQKVIEEVFSKSAFSIFGKYLHIRYILSSDLIFPLQVGFSVSKRLYKKAHDRNLHKRWIREAYRDEKDAVLSHLLKADTHMAVFIILNKKMENPCLVQLREDLNALLSKLKLKIKT